MAKRTVCQDEEDYKADQAELARLREKEAQQEAKKAEKETAKEAKAKVASSNDEE